jgi:glucokinase
MMKSSHTDSCSPSLGGGRGEALTHTGSYSTPLGGVRGGYSVAIDLGGTYIKIGLLKNGELIERKEIPAQSASGLKAQLPDLEYAIDQLILTNQLSSADILGIGFSFAGLIDSSENRIISTNQKYDDGPEIDLVGWAKLHWNCPLFAENDARMALLGEWKHGAGKECENIVMVTLGTGIGSAVLIEGKLLKGKHFQAGNLGGHFTVNHRGTICTCGNKGCMESEASTWRLPELIQTNPNYEFSSLKNEALLDYEAIFRNAKNKDSLTLEILDHCFSVWSAGIITMIHAFDPEIIIISGGIMKSSSVILPELQSRINQHAWTPWGKVRLLEAQYPDSAALYGADYLVRSSTSKNLI